MKRLLKVLNKNIVKDMPSQEKNVIRSHWGYQWKLKQEVRASCRQGTAVRVFLHTFFSGKVKNDRIVLPMRHGNAIFEEIIPMQRRKYKKKVISIEICVKVVFLNTS